MLNTNKPRNVPNRDSHPRAMAPLWPRLAVAVTTADLKNGGSVMDVLMDESTAEQALIEMEIEELVHRDVVDLRKQAKNDSKAADDISSLLNEMSFAAVHEIDSLISELKITRERLVIEAERVHREFADYAALNQSAIQATRIIVASLNHSKQVAESPSIAVP